MTDQKIITTGPTVEGQHVLIVNAGVSTQVANPSRASWRTAVQSIVSFLLAVNILLPVIAGYLTANVDGLSKVLGPLYGSIVIGVNAAGVIFALGAKLVALLMAQPGVDAWITKYLPALAPIKPSV